MCRLVLCTCVEASALQGRLWTPTRQRALSAARTRARTRFLPRLVGYDRYRPRHVVWGMSTSTRTTPPTPSSVSSTSRVGRPKSCKKSGFQYTFSRVPRQCCEHLVRGIVSKGFKKANATPSNSGGKLSSIGAASRGSASATAGRGAADAFVILFRPALRDQPAAADHQTRGLKSRARKRLSISPHGRENKQTKNRLA